MKYGEFFNGLLNSLGIPKLTKDSFTRKPSFLDWLDTKKAQKDLQFQRYTYNDYLDIFKKNMRRYLPITKVFGIFVKWVIKLKSPYSRPGASTVS